MNVLVTGVRGFVAPHVAAALAARGHHVIGADALPENTPDHVDRAPWHEYRQVSLEDPSGAAGAVEGVDAICHLAGVGDVYVAFNRPDIAATANVTATAALLSAAQKASVRRVVYASTWEVYGTPQFEPLTEAHPCNPDHPYNITKYAGERITIAFDHLYGLPTVALRLGTAYGLGMRPNSVFSIFVDRARRGESLTIAGDGSQGRQFTHVRDIAAAFALAVERSDVRGEALNTVADEMITIRRLAESVASRYPVDIVFGPPRVGDIAPSRVSSARARSLLGWEAQVPFADGLEELFRASERSA